MSQNNHFPKWTLVFILSVCPAVVTADVVHPSADHLFGISAGYNAVIFGNYTGISGDTEGHLAVQGNVDIQNHAIGAGQMVAHQEGPVLVVGGSVYAGSSGVYDGDAYIGGSLNTTGGYWNGLTANDNTVVGYNSLDPDYKATTGDFYIGDTSNFGTSLGVYGYMHQLESSLPFDFAVAKDQLTQVSTDLRNLTANATGTQDFLNATLYDYVIDLTDMSGLQVVDVDASILNGLGKSGSIRITGGEDTTLIINVTNEYGLDVLTLNSTFYVNGEAGEAHNGIFDGRNILITTDIGTVDVNTTLNASLLALDSVVNVTAGHVSGQTFASEANLTGGGEFHAYYTFDDKHFTSNVPEPATMLIFGLGLGALPLARRFRKKAVQ